MRKLTSKLIVLTTIAILPNLTSYAQSAEKINVVTSAVPFLRISPDARGGGMGEVGIATAPDANAAYWNLAKSVWNKSKGGVGFTYTPWLKDLGLNDVYMANLSGYYKLDDQQAISASLRYFSLGNIQFTDNLGNDLTSQKPREFAFDAGYSRKLNNKLSVGIAGRYINSNLAGGQQLNGVTYKAGTSVAADLSVFYNNQNATGEGVSLGAVMSNLGTKISYTDNTQKDYIPANLGLGAAYTKVLDETSKLTFGLDLNKLLVPTPPAANDPAALTAYRDKTVVASWFSSFGDAPDGMKEELREFQASLGAEYGYNDQFFFRAGYFYEGKTKGNRRYLTAGVGVKYNIFGLNFSYIAPTGNGINRNPLSNTLRFSLTFDFDGASASK
jgi:hypothetical protein